MPIVKQIGLDVNILIGEVTRKEVKYNYQQHQKDPNACTAIHRVSCAFPLSVDTVSVNN